MNDTQYSPRSYAKEVWQAVIQERIWFLLSAAGIALGVAVLQTDIAAGVVVVAINAFTLGMNFMRAMVKPVLNASAEAMAAVDNLLHDLKEGGERNGKGK